MKAHMQFFRRGMIILWSSSIGHVPGGWVICNGANNTPDMRNRFIVGAGSTYDPDDIGGAATHLHGYLSDNHTHSLPVGNDVQAGSDLGKSTTQEQIGGDTYSESNLPPYYALYYIMKL